MSPDFEVRMEIAKANHAKLAIHHTSGTKSFARSRHELGHELGRPPRRGEVYIETHTKKSGVPTQNAEPIIVEGGLGGVHDAVTRKPTDDILRLMEMRHFVVNIVRLCKQTYDLCLPFDLAGLYVCFSFCNDDLSWIKMIELDVLLNVGLNEDLRDTFIR